MSRNNSHQFSNLWRYKTHSFLFQPVRFVFYVLYLANVSGYNSTIAIIFQSFGRLERRRSQTVNKSGILRTSPSILRALANTQVQCDNKPYYIPNRDKYRSLDTVNYTLMLLGTVWFGSLGLGNIGLQRRQSSNGDSRFENRFMIDHDNGHAIKILPFQGARRQVGIRSVVYDSARLVRT